MEIAVKNHGGRVYLTREVREVLTTSELKGYTSKKAVILFPADVSLEQVTLGLQSIQSEIKLKQAMKREEENAENTRRH